MLEGVTPAWLHGMFSRIAPRYDLTNVVISAGLDRVWRWRLAQRVAQHMPRDVLDVACGTGGVLMQVGRHCPAATRLVGVDFTIAMLHVGRRRLTNSHTPNRMHFCAGDAQRLPYRDACFDMVTMMFGVRNFVAPGIGLAECYRVLRPGGYLCLVEFSWPQARLWRLLYGGYLRYILPLVAWPLTGEWAAYGYLRNSVLAFRPHADLTGLLSSVGFWDVSALPLSGGITMLYEGHKPASSTFELQEGEHGDRLADDPP
jgi:demethylmenaquinone methyltransferase/2-methoxy-6-polyprenyl-1,4-benzoquinol methylase